MNGAARVIELVLSWIVMNGFTFLVVILDERRLSEEALERAWPPSSRDAAIVAFGIFAVPIHFVRTRTHWRSARGLLGLPWGLFLGIVAAALILVASELVLQGIAWAAGLPEI